MQALSFALIEQLKTKDAIVLQRAMNEEGECFFLYLKTDKKGIDRLFQAYENRSTITFSEYGEIIASGWGNDPPEDTHTKILNLFSEGNIYG